MPNSPIDILILTNGPGELATWVRPVVQTLRQQLGEDRSRLQISVVLSPCPNASGKEADIARSYPEIDRVQGAADFGSFLLWGKTAQNWDWRKKGVVLFLGGDQLFTAILGRRLGYRTVVYAEWEARWHRWIDRFGVTKPEVMAGVSPQYAHKFTVVGDLMADIQSQNSPRRDPPTPLKKPHSSFPPFPVQDSPRRDPPTPLIRGLSSVPPFQVQDSPRRDPPTPLIRGLSSFPFCEGGLGGIDNNNCEPELIGILPGSKALKLSQGVPLSLSIAESIYHQRPQTRFVIPVAPTLDLETLARFANPNLNPLIHQFGWTTAELCWEEESQTGFLHPSSIQAKTISIPPNPPSQGGKSVPRNPVFGSAYLQTRSGLKVYLWTQYPAYELLSQCRLCLTTVGANTAELGSLAVPMLVLLPTHQLDAMRAWDGLPGLLANLPIIGSGFARLVNRMMWFWLTRKGKETRFAWPNIWAGESIVPELVGQLKADDVAELTIDYLQHPEKLAQMRDRLRQVRGKFGAAEKLVQLVREELKL